ncbi:hypothetical protein GCM10023310_33150 [Paenibacillus vulneris]|uniref:Erythromycin esterase family protein n=1 Tax=Paenibacillus vulneris TaxID=1133364 RepID=A0ABW3UT81_9BACL
MPTIQANRTKIIEEIQKLSRPLAGPDAMNPIIEAAGASRFVLLGEASHGTSEFYKLRSELTQRFIQDKGFRFIAVEGDWPSCFIVNRYIKGLPGAASNAEEALQDFHRWPAWMWANQEILELVEWLKSFNAERPLAERVGFYGLDVYSLWESMEQIVSYLERTGSPHVQKAKAAFECFDPYGREGQSYGMSASLFSEGCEEEVVQLLAKLRTERSRTQDPEEAALDAEINGLVAMHAEQYYRAMITKDVESWNIRDRHMVEALKRIAAFYGPDAKAIVWEHNTHIGDARATDMAADGMINVGQLLREEYGPHEVFAVGFGTHHGTVMAGRAWGEDAEVMEVPEGIRDSWEDLLHRSGSGKDLMLMLRDVEETSELMHSVIGHRAIGVVYHPQYERGNYVPTKLPKRYDAFLFIDETKAVQPLAVVPVS